MTTKTLNADANIAAQQQLELFEPQIAPFPPHIDFKPNVSTNGKQSLEKAYFGKRWEQMELFDREFTPIDQKASQVIFDAASRAIKEVDRGTKQSMMHVVSLGTGLGKSTSAFAFIATKASLDPEFTAAYVVPTIRMAIEAQEGIELLLGEGSTVLWSSYHKHVGVNEQAAKAELGFVPTRRVNKADLPMSRIVIVTHRQLKHELEAGRDEGTMSYMGVPRKVVFIDEHPDLVDIFSAKSSDILRLHDKLVEIAPEHPWLPVISNAAHRMASLMQSTGQTYRQTEVLSEEEGLVLEDDHGLNLWGITDEELSTERRKGELAQVRSIVAFLQAASRGNAFYSAKDFCFFAYHLHFQSTYPGFVLLDATSDILGHVPLHPHAHVLEVPAIDYANLELFHVPLPLGFRDTRQLAKMRTKGLEYGEFIQASILANTAVGDKVLVVVHKDILTQELLPSSDDPMKPMDWKGRQVNTQHWGAGVGSNRFKDKTHVFLFGDFILPRHATIANTHGWSQTPLDDKELAKAEGRRLRGTVYAPLGRYRKPHQGYILRWTKQLAMRGTARQVDANGKCHPMKLFMTMDLELLLPQLSKLFPGAQPPQLATIPLGASEKPVKGRQGLIQLLLSTQQVCRLGADEVQQVTGIPTYKLASVVEELIDQIAPLGWRVVSAAELGLAGRMKYLIHDQREAALLRKAA